MGSALLLVVLLPALGALVNGTRAFAKLPGEPFGRYRQELREDLEGLGIRAPVIEDAEDAGMLEVAAVELGVEGLDVVEVVMRDHLSQEELRREPIVADEPRLLDRIGMGIRPAAEGQIRHVLADLLAQLPGV